MEIQLAAIKNKQIILWKSPCLHAWRQCAWLLILKRLLQSQVNVTVWFMPLNAEGLKIHWSVPRSMERSSNLKHFSAVCSWCVPAISLLGYRLGTGAWTSGKMSVHSTALWLQEHLEWADHTQYFSHQVFFSLRHFSCLFSAFLGRDPLKVFSGVTVWKLLITSAEKNVEETNIAGLEHIIPHSLHISITPASYYLRACPGPEHSNCAEECT